MNKTVMSALIAALPFLARAADSLTVNAVNKLQIACASRTIELAVSAAP